MAGETGQRQLEQHAVLPLPLDWGRDGSPSRPFGGGFGEPALPKTDALGCFPVCLISYS
jgi:hypothetical protein